MTAQNPRFSPISLSRNIMPKATINCAVCSKAVRDGDNYARHLRTHVNDNPMPEHYAKQLAGTPVFVFPLPDRVFGGERFKQVLCFCQACSTTPMIDDGFLGRHRARHAECFTEEGLKKCVKPRKYPKKITKPKVETTSAPALLTTETLAELRKEMEVEEGEEDEEDNSIENLVIGLLSRVDRYRKRIEANHDLTLARTNITKLRNHLESVITFAESKGVLFSDELLRY